MVVGLVFVEFALLNLTSSLMRHSGVLEQSSSMGFELGLAGGEVSTSPVSGLMPETASIDWILLFSLLSLLGEACS